MNVVGVFTINGSATRGVEMADGLTVEQVAERMYAEAEGVSLCHQCAGEIDDPELGDLTQLVIDGKVYVPGEVRGSGDETWVEWTP
jgi:hypothetical protein